jgi:uncharacterized protein involved in exopolysaccharide biosynthesis
MDLKLQRTLEELIYEKHEEAKNLRRQLRELEKNASDNLQTAFQLAAANELIERERQEKAELEAENTKLRRALAKISEQVREAGIADA